MKTRYKIIIVGIVLTTIVFGTHQSLMHQCGTLPVFMETPRNPNLWNCLEIWEKQSKQSPPPINLSAERDSAWVTGAEDELYNLGCDKLILEYLYRSSNLLDDDFDGNYFQNFIGLPEGVSKEKFEECVDFILGQRTESAVTDSLKIPNTTRDAKLAAGYKLYPGVGWVHPDDLGNQQPIYRDNPNKPGELILDLDAMIKAEESERLSQVLRLCENTDAQYLGALSFENSTHHIDSQTCTWRLVDEN